MRHYYIHSPPLSPEPISKGVLEHFFRDGVNSPVGCDMLVTGTVPAGSGLSSSAAMVVASTLAFLSVNDKLNLITKGSLVEIAMENERRVGEFSSFLKCFTAAKITKKKRCKQWRVKYFFDVTFHFH